MLYVISYIVASCSDMDIKSLKGVLIKLVAYASIAGEDISVSFAKEFIEEYVRKGEFEMSTEQINTKLAQIGHFQLHPELLPHVGHHYYDYRILLIGESHYLPTDDEINYENHEDVFKNWYEDKLEHIPGVPDEYWEEDRCWFNTRGIIADFLNGGQCDNEFLTTPNKLFDEVMREKKMVSAFRGTCRRISHY